MRIQGHHTYYVYILTNQHKTVLYTGVTNDLRIRLQQHKEGAEKREQSFTARYNCFFLVHYEKYTWIQEAIAREKEIKSWTRKKKEELISRNNPKWEFLNHHFFINL
ncbi:GIY-YIG nuclease family protein [Antarcticibacterium flavum]|uniref:GIY-YIG nuclease family protein n=1 Tax=Antarcticibacterium flavum TaxID=2058175 RepID=A0A5B7X133_9FLAO|nr:MULTISPECIES: GIY-YIG nuclease family protein [Antarcticibacterium]MCM4161460.1 endonuclease [Antarcticibacterium sp. W02-3]QCY69304.1 GIY-YIG nuclease family protein [Antarcticibacterium flavum]